MDTKKTEVRPQWAFDSRHREYHFTESFKEKTLAKGMKLKLPALKGKDLPAAELVEIIRNSVDADSKKEAIQSMKLFTTLPLSFYKTFLEIQYGTNPVIFPTMRQDKNKTVRECMESHPEFTEGRIQPANWETLGWASLEHYELFLGESVLFAFSTCMHYCETPRVFDADKERNNQANNTKFHVKQLERPAKRTNIISVCGQDYRAYSGNSLNTLEQVYSYTLTTWEQILKITAANGITDFVQLPAGDGAFLRTELNNGAIRAHRAAAILAALEKYDGPPLTIHCSTSFAEFSTCKNKRIRVLNKEGLDAYFVNNEIQDLGDDLEDIESLESFDLPSDYIPRQRKSAVLNGADSDWVSGLNPEKTPGQACAGHNLLDKASDEYFGLNTLFSLFSTQQYLALYGNLEGLIDNLQATWGTYKKADSKNAGKNHPETEKTSNTGEDKSPGIQAEPGQSSAPGEWVYQRCGTPFHYAAISPTGNYELYFTPQKGKIIYDQLLKQCTSGKESIDHRIQFEVIDESNVKIIFQLSQTAKVNSLGGYSSTYRGYWAFCFQEPANAIHCYKILELDKLPSITRHEPMVLHSKHGKEKMLYLHPDFTRQIQFVPGPADIPAKSIDNILQQLNMKYIQNLLYQVENNYKHICKKGAKFFGETLNHFSLISSNPDLKLLTFLEAKPEAPLQYVFAKNLQYLFTEIFFTRTGYCFSDPGLTPEKLIDTLAEIIRQKIEAQKQRKLEKEEAKKARLIPEAAAEAQAIPHQEAEQTTESGWFAKTQGFFADLENFLKPREQAESTIIYPDEICWVPDKNPGLAAKGKMVAVCKFKDPQAAVLFAKQWPVETEKGLFPDPLPVPSTALAETGSLNNCSCVILGEGRLSAYLKSTNTAKNQMAATIFALKPGILEKELKDQENAEQGPGKTSC